MKIRPWFNRILIKEGVSYTCKYYIIEDKWRIGHQVRLMPNNFD